jgi:hypothetical protein
VGGSLGLAPTGMRQKSRSRGAPLLQAPAGRPQDGRAANGVEVHAGDGRGERAVVVAFLILMWRRSLCRGGWNQEGVCERKPSSLRISFRGRLLLFEYPLDLFQRLRLAQGCRSDTPARWSSPQWEKTSPARGASASPRDEPSSPSDVPQRPSSLARVPLLQLAGPALSDPLPVRRLSPRAAGRARPPRPLDSRPDSDSGASSSVGFRAAWRTAPARTASPDPTLQSRCRRLGKRPGGLGREAPNPAFAKPGVEWFRRPFARRVRRSPSHTDGPVMSTGVIAVTTGVIAVTTGVIAVTTGVITVTTGVIAVTHGDNALQISKGEVGGVGGMGERHITSQIAVVFNRAARSNGLPVPRRPSQPPPHCPQLYTWSGPRIGVTPPGTRTNGHPSVFRFHHGRGGKPHPGRRRWAARFRA